ncbi:MAG: chemotaxis protein CheA [Bdellovibrio sp.]
MSSDNAFFEELQMDFLNESAFMLEQYEEYMMRLENSKDPSQDLTDIFRVAHSVKGGAAAVGLVELSKFAHVMEDLLDLLRSRPQLVSSEIISLLLKSGDELKKRIASLQQGDNSPWNTQELKTQLIEITEKLSGKKPKHSSETAEIPVKSAHGEIKEPAPDDFFSGVIPVEGSNPGSVAEPALAVEEDLTNHELLAELLAQMPPEERENVFDLEPTVVVAGSNTDGIANGNGSAGASVNGTAIDAGIAKVIVAESQSQTQSQSQSQSESESANGDYSIVPIARDTVNGPIDNGNANARGNSHGNDISNSNSNGNGNGHSQTAASDYVSQKAISSFEKEERNNTAAVITGDHAGNGNNNNKPASKTLNSIIKVDTGRVDSVLDAVGELVVLKNQLVHDETVRSGVDLRLQGMVDQLDKAVRELYEKTLSIRMTPLKSMFIKIQRIVRDVSLSLDKPVDLQLIGEETEVERTVFELLGDPLVHIVRNSMDHGVEKKEVRLERGKPVNAKVIVSAKQSGGNVIIEITDDGGGINREKVLKKAIEKGFIPENVDPQSIPDDQVFQYIFQPGFSTADKISDLSGRGVGLDVVKSNLDKIHGKINIFSKLGQGTTFRLTIPLSTAITDGIIVALNGARYILPIHSIREIVRVLPKDYTNISGAGKVASIRGSLLPVIDVSKTLGCVKGLDVSEETFTKNQKSLSARREETMLVIIESITGQMAFPVDDVLGQAQVVVKPISTGQEIPEIAGAAILGDGRTVLILEPGALVNNAREVAA